MYKVLVHTAGDDVGVAVAPIGPGERVAATFLDASGLIEVEACSVVPFGHKIALRSIGVGAPVIEYGIQIGVASSDLVVGEHVHTHNLRSARW